MQVRGQLARVTRPILPHGNAGMIAVSLHRAQPWREESGVDAFHRIETEAVHSCGRRIPYAPIRKLPGDLRFVDIDVISHDVIEVAAFMAHIVAPLLAVETHDARRAIIGRVIGAGEIAPVPFECRIHAAAFGEIVYGVQGAFDHGGVASRAVVHIHFMCAHRFRSIGTHAVVEHDVREYTNTIALHRANRLKVLHAGAVFGGNRAFGIELPKIVHVIDAVSHV